MDVFVKDGDELPIFGGMKVLHTPRHTPGSICLFFQEQRAVIAGDVLGNRFGLSLPSKIYSVDIAQEINSIKRVASLDFDVIYFGHGSPILHKAHYIVSDFVEKLESKFSKQLCE